MELDKPEVEILLGILVTGILISAKIFGWE